MTVERDGKDVELAFKPDVQVRYLLGFNRKSTDSLEVASLIPGMGLSETGVEPGDVITSINGTRLAEFGRLYCISCRASSHK